jgi:hypothetical protein
MKKLLIQILFIVLVLRHSRLKVANLLHSLTGKRSGDGMATLIKPGG